jgi:hypothetical protein
LTSRPSAYYVERPEMTILLFDHIQFSEDGDMANLSREQTPCNPIIISCADGPHLVLKKILPLAPFKKILNPVTVTEAP